jgi:hypothetical protein
MIRKIQTKKDLEKEENKKKIIMSVVLGVIMLLSTAGYFVNDMFSDKKISVKIENTEFKKADSGYWEFKTLSGNYLTLYNPLETKNVSVNFNLYLDYYNGKPLYFSSEPIEDLPVSAIQEILRNIGQLTLRNSYACLSNNCSADYPIKNCSADNIIIYEESKNNVTSVTQEDKCVKIYYSEGKGELVSDAFLFKILGL